MHYRRELAEKAKKAADKKATLGPDVNLDEFEKAEVPHDSLTQLPYP